MSKRTIAVIVLVAIALALVFTFVSCGDDEANNALTIGFVYDNDETTPYSYNFFLAQKEVQETYKNDVRVMISSNILDDDMNEEVKKLAEAGCKIIFTNSYGNIRDAAAEYPDVQFCQVSGDAYPESEARDNYHTFKGEAYQARYLSGVVAGLKLEEMIKAGKLEAKDAKLGFVAAYPYPEVVSGFTAFLLGARSVVPETTMSVKYTYIWSSYTLEKECAKELLNEGCIIISQHSDTVGPAIACEEHFANDCYHIGYNIDMTNDAPNTSLTSARINWAPYILSAVKAVLEGKRIEDVVEGTVHAHNDMSAGFEDGWVALTDFNAKLMPEGTAARIEEARKELADGRRKVFYGDYTGTDPETKMTIDLHTEYEENKNSSMPSFCYILDGIVTVED